MPSQPEITEFYNDWTPPVDPKPIIARLLASVPDEYKTGLAAVVLTRAAALNRKRRRRTGKLHGKKFRDSTACGLYHHQWQGKDAWIELFVDPITRDSPGWFLRRGCFQDFLFGETLFHEIGHHIDATKLPEHADPEAVAEKWSNRLMGHYFWRRRPVFALLMRMIRPLQPLVLWLFNLVLRAGGETPLEQP